MYLSSFANLQSHPLQAPSEAEAQCAELARGGKVFVFLVIYSFVFIFFRSMRQGQRTWIH